MSLYHLIRYSVAPEHATAWAAAQTVATIFGIVVAGIYVLFTYWL
jgi:hypothetical protein